MTQTPSLVDIVLDASVLFPALIPPNDLKTQSAEHTQQHSASLPYLHGLRHGTYRAHLPRICIIETCATIAKRVETNPVARALAANQIFLEWERDGVISLYSLDEDMMLKSINAAVIHKQDGMDSIYVALAQDLSLPLMTFDKNILNGYIGASSP